MCWSFLIQNSFPMAEWHLSHMEKTVVKYVTGLSNNASRWETRQHKRYGKISIICRQIEYDIKHGVTVEQVQMYLQKIRTHSTFLSLLMNEGALKRLNELELHFSPQIDRGYERWSRVYSNSSPFN
jgi:hypothetical protein